MDLFQLTYFVEVAHKKSFTKASKSLHISQPSISKGIKSLETHWNVTLFNRSGKQVELTEMGAWLLPRIETLIKDMSQLNEQIGSPDFLNSGKLAVGIPPMIGSSFISPFVRQFISTYPKIELELLEVGSNDIISSIDEGLIQAGFVALPVSTEMPYDFFIFNEEYLEVVLWPGHPLADKETLTLEEIKDEPLVYYPKSFSLNPFIKTFYQRLTAHPKIVCQSSNWDFQAEIVRTQLGIALLPHTICQCLDEKKYVHIPLVEPQIPWTLAMVWKSKGFLPHPARTWVQSFKQYYEKRNAEKGRQTEESKE